MSDNVERIVVEVDGGQAQSAFDAIASRARNTDTAINQLGSSINTLQTYFNNLSRANGTVNTTLRQTGNAGNQAAQGVNNAGNAATRATSQFNLLQQSLFGVRGKAAFIWDMAIDGFRAAMGFAEAFIERTSAVQRTLSLLATIRNGPGAQSEFAYLTETANNYGLSLRAIQDDYAKLNLAAQATKLTQEDVRRVFEQVSMATRTLHLNQQQTQLTFLAVEQMLSKGKVSMEELRKQFAERVPGAMQALARELGVTAPVFYEFIEKVGAASEKIVPALGNAVQRLYQDALPLAARALDAEKNRIETSVAVFFKNVVEAGGAEGMSDLLRSINSLLQVETVANTFANAMNKITGNIATFLSTLTTEDIEQFADTALDFLSSLAELALAAGKAVVFLANNLPAVGAAIGAFMGATTGAPLGPWGAAIGLIGGGIGGFVAGSSMQGAAGGMGEAQKLMERYQKLDSEVREFDQEIEKIKKDGGFLSGIKLNHMERRRDFTAKLRDEAWAKVEPMTTGLLESQSPRFLNTPELPDLPNLITDRNQALAMLRQKYGLEGGNSKAEQAAERLMNRQLNFVQDLEAKVKALTDPESSRFEAMRTNMEQLGIKSGPMYERATQALAALQADYNAKKEARAQEISDRKTQATNDQFANYMNSVETDSFKFGERYNFENLTQLSDSDWAVKARRMANQLDIELAETKKRWDKFAAENPLFNFGFDREKRLQEMRDMGDAYIAEWTRIEKERRTIQGGAKDFLRQWNEDATNYGKMTSDFLKGVSQGITDMLLDAVKTGEFSFRKLGEYILDYIMKMLIIKAITPFINWGVDSLVGLVTPGGPIGVPPNPYAGARAMGGPVWPGESYLVGENGPERFVPDSKGYIAANDGSYGSSYVNVTVHVQSDGASKASVNGESSAKYGDLGRKLGDAVRTIIVDEKRPGGLLAA